MRPLIALLFAAPAWAADHELSFDIGTTTTPSAFESFDNDGALLQYGGRGAFALNDHFAVQLGYTHSRTGTSLVFGETDPGTAPRAAWFGNELSLGPRFDWPLWGWFVPYVRADGLLLIADARLDDDPNDADSPGQLREMGYSGGARGMGGIDFQLPRKEKWSVTGGLYLEAGYSWLSPTHFDTFGEVHLQGFTFRSGIGVRL